METVDEQREARRQAQLRYRLSDKGKAKRREAQARYRARHPERWKAANARWLETHPTFYRDRARRRYAANPAAKQEANKRWRTKNRAKENAAARRARARDPERARARQLAWMRANPGKVAATLRRFRASDKGVEYVMRQRAERRGATVFRMTAADWRARRAEFDGRCSYCFAPCADPHRDHVQALAIGGQHVRENIVPACAGCNLSKGKKPLMRWLFPERTP